MSDGGQQNVAALAGDEPDNAEENGERGSISSRSSSGYGAGENPNDNPHDHHDNHADDGGSPGGPQQEEEQEVVEYTEIELPPTVELQTAVMDDNDDDFLMELEAYNRKGHSNSVLKPKVAERPQPQQEDANARGRAFQKMRKGRPKWKPNLIFFSVPEGFEKPEPDNTDDKAWKDLIGKFNESIKGKDIKLSLGNTQAPEDQFVDIASRGANFMKYGRFGKPKIKIVRVDPATGKLDWGSGRVSLKDAMYIRAGKNTKVFEGVKHKYAHPSVCFSVVLNNRTVDLRASSQEERDLWVHGLTELKMDLDKHGYPEDTAKAGSDSDSEDDVEVDDDKDVAYNFAKLATDGTPVTKYTRRGNPHKKKLRVDLRAGVLDWETGTASLLTCLSIQPGKTTHVLQAQKKAPETCCFSVVTPDRTLDLQVKSSKVRDIWVHGLKDLKTKMEKQQGEALNLAIIEAHAQKEEDKSRPWTTVATAGVFMIKHGRYGKPHERLIRVNLNTGVVDWGSGTLNLIDAVDIVAGKNTTLFQNVKHKVADPRVCFSVIMDTRTLDLQAASEIERTAWVTGLRQLKAELDPDWREAIATAQHADPTQRKEEASQANQDDQAIMDLMEELTAEMSDDEDLLSLCKANHVQLPPPSPSSSTTSLQPPSPSASSAPSSSSSSSSTATTTTTTSGSSSPSNSNPNSLANNNAAQNQNTNGGSAVPVNGVNPNVSSNVSGNNSNNNSSSGVKLSDGRIRLTADQWAQRKEEIRERCRQQMKHAVVSTMETRQSVRTNRQASKREVKDNILTQLKALDLLQLQLPKFNNMNDSLSKQVEGMKSDVQNLTEENKALRDVAKSKSP